MFVLKLTYTFLFFNIATFSAYPLPSAGVIAIMQAFCDNGIRGENGFKDFPNST